mmetsp:Transcript_2256/g.5219  ORF Transcript_2256/g.5219 Transcript_2256/m.5219 type:complete len:200 (-) Transcript_2256:441-1040(-)
MERQGGCEAAFFASLPHVAWLPPPLLDDAGDEAPELLVVHQQVARRRKCCHFPAGPVPLVPHPPQVLRSRLGLCSHAGGAGAHNGSPAGRRRQQPPRSADGRDRLGLESARVGGSHRESPASGGGERGGPGVPALLAGRQRGGEGARARERHRRLPRLPGGLAPELDRRLVRPRGGVPLRRVVLRQGRALHGGLPQRVG